MREKKFKREVDYSSVLKLAICVVMTFGLSFCAFLQESVGFGALMLGTYFGFPIASTMGYIVAKLLQSWSISTVLTAIAPALIFLIVGLVLKRIYGLTKRRTYILVGALCQLIRLVQFQVVSDLVQVLVIILAMICFFLVGANGLKAPFMRGVHNVLSTDERICLAIVVLAFYTGAYPLHVLGIHPIVVLGTATLLASLYFCKLSTVMSLALVFGFAECIVTGDSATLGGYAVCILVASAFKNTSKILAVLGLVLADLLLAYYLNLYGSYQVWDIVELLLGGVLFLILPSSLMQGMNELMSKKGAELEGLVVARNRALLSARLNKMSVVFAEMNRVFLDMCHGCMDKEGAVELFYNDFIERLCKTCENYDACYGGKAYKMREGIQKILMCGVEKGRITLIDIPDTLAKKCAKTNLALQIINQYCVSYRQYAASVQNLDQTRSIIAKQLLGVSKVMLALSEGSGTEVSYNANAEKVIVDELLTAHILCLEAVVCTERGLPLVNLMVRSRDAANSEIARIVSKAVGRTMMVAEHNDCKRIGFKALRLQPAPKFDAVFGAAGCPKAGGKLSGDTHSLTQLSEDRFMLALCDGMGSGISAEQTSSNSISLIENFYRAGFDSELVLDSVNGLMSSCSEEMFCAIDICVVDLKTARCDFIKLGAVPSFIKGRSTEMVQGNALPLGILEESKPATTISTLDSGDMVVILTDGISDALGGLDKVKKFVEESDGTNPQELAESLLEYSVKRSNDRPKDDMTVLTFRIYEKVV